MNRTDELRDQGARERNARDLLVASLDGEDPFVVIADIERLGERKAEAEALAYYMEHERKAVLARIATDIASANPREGISEAKLDRLARSHERYEQHLMAERHAREASEKAQAEYWARRSRLEWLDKVVSHWNAASRLSQP